MNKAFHLPSNRLLWERKDSLTYIFSALTFCFPLRGSSGSFFLFRKILMASHRLTRLTITILLLSNRRMAWKWRFSTFTQAISTLSLQNSQVFSRGHLQGSRLALHIICDNKVPSQPCSFSGLHFFYYCFS